MIFNVDANFLFVHIPRTAGIAITDALLSAFPDSYVDVIDLRHRYAMGCKSLDRLGDVWNRLYKFAVIRNPWEIVESDFRLLSRDISTLHLHSKMELSNLWHRKLLRVSKYRSFSEFVAREYLGRDVVWEGGFWRTWCCDKEGKDLGLDVLRYESLDEDWQKVCVNLGSSLKLDRMNSAEDIHFSHKYTTTVFRNLGIDRPEIREMPKIKLQLPFPCVWRPVVRDGIGELCCLDIEKFGYEFRGQLVG